MELYRRLGRVVADRRAEKGLTQGQVGAQLGLTRASVANIENGRQRIMVHQLFVLANILKCKSILELVPETWAFETAGAKLKELSGQKLSPKEEASVQGLLATALSEDRRRKRQS